MKGMTYYLTLWYPTSRIAHRIGWYFTAAQLSAAVVGLVSAGFQKMNRDGGLRGYAWSPTFRNYLIGRMFLIYGIVTFLDGVLTLWWLPDRPDPIPETSRWWSLVPKRKSLLSPADAELHKDDMELHSSSTSYHRWTLHDLLNVLMNWRVWPLVIMYFGVVGVGVGLQNYGSLIIAAINPNFTSIQLSLLFAPIWLCDAAGILLITPFSDRYNTHRALFFSGSCLIIIAGLLVTTLAEPVWGRYSGLLIAGFGLGPTVPICMCWTAELFGPRHGEVGIAAASAIVSGLGNLGSVTTVRRDFSEANDRHMPFTRGGLQTRDITKVTSLPLDCWEQVL
jgi:MFS family permease